MIALVVFPKPDIQSSIDDSSIATALLDAAPAVLAFLPGTFEKGLNAFMDGAQAVSGALPRSSPTPTR